ncbi:COX15/CtaA family protein [Microlunatus soli]|uniref:Cytochrome c oxidase assembly protein subunit 15 n=1 Tax=Microlunatus soli TaxID=630515 RepID=A0A1H1P6I6_9ACTN|nr:COX15/CtaA family protein [Microlunatus soli]SDS06259.1 cytochrome c oxidase assembly protein subunit 15 [Microlunatus soli]
MGSLTDLRPPAPLGGLGSPRWLRRLGVASLVMNIVIILTGGLVRLTDSGLGCPTWPQCTPGSYTPHQALGIHGVIEFGNRTLTFVLIVIALITWIATLLYRRPDGTPDRKLRWLTFGMGFGIPFQGVIGGITVHTGLNPYVVALHMLNSMVLVALSAWLVRLTWPAPRRTVSGPARALSAVIFALSWLVVCLGTVVTGSGPHAGDVNAHRTGLDPVVISHLHATAVYALVAATVLLVIMLRGHRPALLLLAVEIAQGIIGFVQYFNGLPIGVVELHLLGAAGTIACASNLFCSLRGPHRG